MLLITLPWPSAVLSPNTRVHWAKLASAKKAYRRECEFATLDQVMLQPYGVIPSKSYELLVSFYRPQRRDFDRDNLLARMKSGLDGMCDALKIDDKRFVSVTVRVADEVIKNGKVEIRIREYND